MTTTKPALFASLHASQTKVCFSFVKSVNVTTPVLTLYFGCLFSSLAVVDVVTSDKATGEAMVDYMFRLGYRLPRMLISVTGGAMDFELPRGMEEKLMSGLQVPY